MKQNIYDVPGFFKSYQRMRDKQAGLNEILEQPAILALIPEVKGLAVLDLGCGAGDLCRKLSDLGARNVTGVDISRNMIDLADKNRTAGVIYLNKAMEDLEFSPETFDLVISSLAFHYVDDLVALFKNIHIWLKPSGILLFSIEHPIFTCTQGLHHGWIKDTRGNKICWPVDYYSQEGVRRSHWFVDGVIKYHRTFSSIVNSLIESGFVLKKVAEPVASEKEEPNRENLKETLRRPPFLIIKAVK